MLFSVIASEYEAIQSIKVFSYVLLWSFAPRNDDEKCFCTLNCNVERHTAYNAPAGAYNARSAYNVP